MTSEASYENTSTTSCMSDSGSVFYANQSNDSSYGVNSNAAVTNNTDNDDVSYYDGHIGEIDEDEGRTMLVAPPSSARSMLSDPTNLQYYVLNDSISSSSTNENDKYYNLTHPGSYNQNHSANRWYHQEGIANNNTVTASDTGMSDYLRGNNMSQRGPWHNYHSGDDDESSVMVDSVTEGIRNHIWEQVHEAKKKVCYLFSSTEWIDTQLLLTLF